MLKVNDLNKLSDCKIMKYSSNKFSDFFISKVTNLDHLLSDCDFWFAKAWLDITCCTLLVLYIDSFMVGASELHDTNS